MRDFGKELQKTLNTEHTRTVNVKIMSQCLDESKKLRFITRTSIYLQLSEMDEYNKAIMEAEDEVEKHADKIKEAKEKRKSASESKDKNKKKSK